MRENREFEGLKDRRVHIISAGDYYTAEVRHLHHDRPFIYVSDPSGANHVGGTITGIM